MHTIQDEPAESVVERLAELINMTDSFEWSIPVGYLQVNANNGILKNLIGGRNTYILAGNETGLGIPKPPISLSCAYDIDGDSIVINWENPEGGYDEISVLLNWSNYNHRGGKTLPGSAERIIIQRTDCPVNLNDLDVWVFGFKAGVPSNAGAIHLSNKGRAQEELSGIPYSEGVSPNWKVWTTDDAIQSKKNLMSLRQNDLCHTKGKRYNPVKNPSQKPFKQILKTPAKGGAMGIYRQFFGLIPNHTYKISARLNTFEMDPKDSSWSYSFHAVADLPGVSDLTGQQMAGLASLPDGKSGAQAGRIAEFGQGVTTMGKYEMHSAEITLPQDSNSITVWLRCSGKITSGVGFDWAKLEDLGQQL